MRLTILLPKADIKIIWALLFASTALLLSSCTPQTGAPIATPEPVTPAPPTLSAAPIIPPSKNDVFFAQASLKKLGYNIGIIDGLWGPRSAKAMQLFENQQNLESADGRLSELNLSSLAELSGIERNAYEKPATITAAKKLAIESKLSQLLSEQKEGPQLIIVDKTFRVLAKPNPFSSELSTLAPGTGIYIIGQQEDNWYEIESINRLRGFIQDY